MRMYRSAPPQIYKVHNPIHYGQSDQKGSTFKPSQMIAGIAFPVAVGIAYSRTKSIPKSLGAGIIAPIYLVYVAYQTVTKKK